MQNKNAHFMLLLFFAALTQPALGEPPRIANVRFEMNDSVVVITYDAVAEKAKAQPLEEETEEFIVIAVLRKENDPGFSYPLTYVSGDVGKPPRPGKNKKILWSIQKEFPDGIEGSDYYFEIRTEPVINDEDNTYTWIGIGAGIAVAGGLATFFMVTGNNNNGEKAGSFPLPPGRPK